MRAAIAAMVVSLFAIEAVAQDADPQALLADAVAEHARGNYEEAYALFLRVHEVQPSARTERALGKAAFELRRYRQAVDWFEQALADTRNPLTHEMRTEVEDLLGRARSFLGHFTLRANVEGAAISVDGRAIEGDSIDLESGDHTIVVRARGYDPLERALRVSGGEDETIELELARARPTSDPGEIHRNLGWASLALGLALATSGAISTAIWADAVSTLNLNADIRACFLDPETESVVAAPDGRAPAAECLDQQARYRLALPFIWIGFAGGAAFLAAAIGLIAGAPSADSVALNCAPYADLGIVCGGRF
jgi:tetratricopeptide (TPR) repeat protein